MIHSRRRQLRRSSLGPSAWLAAPSIAMRLPRFMLTGGLSGLLQVCLLAVLTHYGWSPVPASATAALLGAQLNFALSSLITWRDRPADVLWRRWLLYHGSIAGTMVLSVIVFALLRTTAPDAVAAAGGIAAGGMANFLLGDQLVFRARPLRAATSASPQLGDVPHAPLTRLWPSQAA